MNQLATRLWSLCIGLGLCLTLALLSSRMSRGEREPTSAPSTPLFASEATCG